MTGMNHDIDQDQGHDTPELGPRRLSLRANFSWTLLGNLAYTAAQWLMLVALAKLGRADASDVGLYTVGQAVCLPIVWLTSLNLRAALVTDARNEYTYGHYVGLRIFTAGTAFLIIVAAAMLPKYGGPGRLIIILMGAGYSIIQVREIILGILMKNECMNYSARSQVLLAGGALGAFVATFSLTRSLAWALTAVIAVRLAMLVLHDIPTTLMVTRAFRHEVANHSLRPDLSWHLLRKLCLSSLPLGLAMTLSSLNNNIPVYFLEHYHGESATGFYGAIASIMVASMIMLNTLGTATSPRLAKYFQTDRKAFLSVLRTLILLGLAAAAVCVGTAWLLGRHILTLLFKATYAEYTTEFVWLMGAAGMMFLVSFAIYSLTAMRGFGHLLVSFVVIVVLCAALASLLIPTYGVQGAAWTRLGSACVALVVLAAAACLKWRSQPAPAPARAGAGSDNPPSAEPNHEL